MSTKVAPPFGPIIERFRRARKGLAVLLGVLAIAGCAQKDAGALTFSTWGSIEEIDTLKQVIAAFEKQNPDVPVRLIHIPDEYPHKVRLMAAAHHMPDVLFMENQTLAGFASRGVLRDLGPFLAHDGSLKAKDFYPPVMQALSYDGKLYAVPRDLSNLVVYYNRQLFDAAHVPYPHAGWTYAEMVADAQKLTHGDQYGIGFSPYPLYWMPYLWSEGGDVMDPAMTHCTLLSPASMRGLTDYWNLRWRYHVAPTEAETGNARMSQLFAQSKIAMEVDGRWVVPGYRKRLDFPWDVAPFPSGSAGSIVDADASGWAISSACKHPDKAWRFVRFLASKPSISTFTASGLIVPSRPDVANSPVFLGGGAPSHGQVFLDVIGNSRPTLAPIPYDEIDYELIDSLGPAWDNEESLKDALGPIAKRIDALLQESRE
ncbi:MAG TPA: sugar ABC transporter substrate-binding protein [Oscillatoriaceae cyanobacterium]